VTDELQQALDSLRQTFWQPTEDEQPEGLLYHYTGIAGFHGILSSRCIRATAYNHLNDPSEMTYGEETFVALANTLSVDLTVPEPQRVLLSEFVQRYELGKVTNLFTPFVASFTGQGGDVASQWEQYAVNGTGYSIGFVPSFGSLLDHIEEAPTAAWLARCHYGSHWFEEMARHGLLERAQTYVAVMEEHGNDQRSIVEIITDFVLSSLHLAATLVPRTKSPEWETEQEYRLIIVPDPEQEGVVEELPGASGPIQFVPLQLAPEEGLVEIGRVYIGPNNDDVGGTIEFLNGLGYDGKELVVASEVSYLGGQ
jgi:hypothetical protein